MISAAGNDSAESSAWEYVDVNRGRGVRGHTEMAVLSVEVDLKMDRAMRREKIRNRFFLCPVVLKGINA